MKFTKQSFLRNTLLAAAGGYLAVASAGAATVSAQSSDIFLAFRASGGQGSSVSYLVNLGQASQFVNAAASGTSFTLGSIGNIGADLVSTYGEFWYNRSDLLWGVVGTATSTDPTVYASKERIDPSVETTPWNALSQTARSATKSDILNVTTDYNGRTSTANSPVGVIQNNTNDVFSYNYQVSGTSTDFGTVSQWSSIEGDFGGGVAGTVLDFYRLRSSDPTVQNLGNFTISQGGVVTFNVIPEPSVSLLGAAGFALLVTRRRRATIA